MNLTPGKYYKADDDGNLVEVEAEADTLVEAEDITAPPDRFAESKQKLEAFTNKLNELSSIAEQPEEERPSQYRTTLTDQQKQEFLDALLSDTPYTQTYSIFKGAVSVTFKTLNTAELDAASEAVMIQSDRVPYSSISALTGAHMRFVLALAIQEIKFEGPEGIRIKHFNSVDSEYTDESVSDTHYIKGKVSMERRTVKVLATPGQKVLWAAVDRFKTISVPLYNALFDCYRRFDNEIVKLTEESSNPDFFRIGEDGPSS